MECNELLLGKAIFFWGEIRYLIRHVSNNVQLLKIKRLFNAFSIYITFFFKLCFCLLLPTLIIRQSRTDSVYLSTAILALLIFAKSSYDICASEESASPKVFMFPCVCSLRRMNLIIFGIQFLCILGSAGFVYGKYGKSFIEKSYSDQTNQLEFNVHNYPIIDPNYLYLSNSTKYRGYDSWPLETKIQEHVLQAGKGCMSIIFPAHNEHKYATRTLESIVNSTMPGVLSSVVIVDDASNPEIVTAFNQSVFHPDFFKVHRFDTRQGLIRARIHGAEKASGQFLMIMDFHVKPDKDWAPPLISQLIMKKRLVVTPVLKILTENWTLESEAVGSKMFFRWNMAFDWDYSLGTAEPIMAGGIYAISREWWKESGELDWNMNQWGCEQIEQSIRIWLCGGEIHYDSRSVIAHLFRKKFPYEVDRAERTKNCVRAVEVWFDEYKHLFYESNADALPYKPPFPLPMSHEAFPINPLIERTEPYENITARFALKKKLQCEPFRSYVERFQDILESHQILPQKTFIITNVLKKICISALTTSNNSYQDMHKSSLVSLPCDDTLEGARWYFHQKKIYFANTPNKCLALGDAYTPTLLDCNATDIQNLGQWHSINETSVIAEQSKNLCLILSNENEPKMAECSVTFNQHSQNILVPSSFKQKIIKATNDT